jgi:hypothetical protein
MNSSNPLEQNKPVANPKSKSEVWAKAIHKNGGECMDDMKKVAFAPRDPNEPKKSFGEQLRTISKHPGDFVASALKGEATGLAAGAIGGAIVAAPLAAVWAKKPKSMSAMKDIINNMKNRAPAGPGILNKIKHKISTPFQGIDASSPTYSKRLAHHLFELGKGETVGGGVIGLGLGMGKFFKKHDKPESGNNHG